MGKRLIAASGILLVCFGSALNAQEAQPAGGKMPSLQSVQWGGPAVNPNALKGKTTIILVYASWCPKCNKWSGDLFKQPNAAIKGQPVVLLAIYADKSPHGAKEYLTQRAFFAPNILHGYDPAMPKRLGFDSNLFNYVMIGPDGRMVDKGSAGGRYPDGEYVLTKKLKTSQNLGEFSFLSPDMSEEVQALLWPCELGGVSESALRAVQKKLPADQKEEVDAAVGRFTDRRLKFIRQHYKGSVPERIEAHQAAVALAGMFKATAQSKKAKQVVSYMEKDSQFKQELAAKKAYEGTLQRIAGNPRRRVTLLRAIAKRFEGTHFGQLAQDSLEDAAPAKQ